MSDRLTADWNVLTVDGAKDAAHGAAVKAARQYAGVTEYDDMYQNALLYLATHPEKVRHYLSDEGPGVGFLSYHVYCRITGALRPTVRAASRSIGHDRLDSLTVDIP